MSECVMSGCVMSVCVMSRFVLSVCDEWVCDECVCVMSVQWLCLLVCLVGYRGRDSPGAALEGALWPCRHCVATGVT